jgi:CRP-like cAMP-binding protein
MDGCFARAAVRAVFLVLDGEVRLSRFAKDGGEIALQRAGRGEFFAEAALNVTRYRCNAIASQATTLIAFPAGKVRKLMDTDPEFAHQWIALLARQLQAARARVERLALKSAAERVLHYLHAEGTGPTCQIELMSSVKELAAELGLTHETPLSDLGTAGAGWRDSPRRAPSCLGIANPSKI